MNNKFILSICFFVLIPIFANTQTVEIKKPKHEKVGVAYGFLLGQEYSLDVIKNKFPELEAIVNNVQINFNLSFGKAKERMLSYLAEFLGEIGYREFEANTFEEVKKTLSNQIITKEVALSYIIEVESRAKGNIVPQVLETLLSFQYATQPQDELLYGFSTVFKTKGHPKSKNTDWQIKVPKSWKAEEADRPNIIQKFISDFGTGNQSIMLMVKEIPLPVGHKITQKERNDFFSEKGMNDIVPKGGKFISFTKMTFDHNDGGMVEYEIIAKRLDVEIKSIIAQFIFIRGTQMYILQGMVGSEKAEINLALEMQKYLPLYKLVANSIVVNGQYR